MTISNHSKENHTDHTPESTTHLGIAPEELWSRLADNQHLMVFDIGDRERFERQHIPGSAYAVCDEAAKRNIMPKLPKNMEIVLVGDDDEYTKQMAQMMAQIGLKTKYLQGGIDAWKWDITRSSSERHISPTDLKGFLDRGSEPNGVYLLDVREPDEFKDWNISGSVNIPLSKLASNKESINEVPKDRAVVTICPHGNRSMIAKYLLERYGFNVSNLEGGLKSWNTSLEDAYKEFSIDNRRVRLYQIRRVGKGCMSYILESDGEAAVIDPVYPTEYYISKVSDMGAEITKVLDTHQHADHISAAKDLAAKTGANLFLSGHEEYDQTFNPLHHGALEKIGAIELNVLHTPGHTDGSLSFLVKGDNLSLLITGDTLFVDGVGRPDLRDKSREFADKLYETLHSKILPLSDTVLVLPSHSDKYTRAGQMSSVDLGWLKRNSELLRLEKHDFIEKVVSQTMVMVTPPNYKQIISINSGRSPIPQTSSDLFELELGPNRCAIS